ncbi:MAG: M56 family metallopeptidase [bacterium]|nr:M56 family metallopeptidase [bacterium]
MIILTLTIAGSVSFALVYLISRLLASSLSHKLRYYALLVPVLLFLVPVVSCFSVTVTKTPYLPEPEPIVLTTTAPASIDAVPAAADETSAAAGTDIIQGTVNDTFYASNTRRLYLSPALLLNIIWLLGAAAVLSVCIYRRIRFCRGLKKAAVNADKTITEHYAHICRAMSVKHPPELKRLDTQITPFITGTFRPQIIVPASLKVEHADCVLRHELMHYKRRDLWFKQLTELVCILHWFNPAAYLLRRCAEQEMELSCDESVSAAMAQTERVLYSKSILMLMHAQSYQYSAALSESSENIRQRLEVIMQNNNYSKITAALTAAAMLTISLVSASAAGNISSKSENGVYSITDTATVYFHKADSQSELIAGKGLGERKVTLVNTPFYKSFHAEINADKFYPEIKLNEDEAAPSGQAVIAGSNGSYTVDSDVETAATFEVTMKSLSNTVDHGRTWVGSFTLTENGVAAFDDIPGTLTNIPGAQTDLCDLNLDLPDNFSFNMSSMNFDLEGETAVNSDYYEEMTEQDMSEGTYYRRQDEDGSYGGYIHSPVRYDENKGLISNLWLKCGEYEISASLNERYSINGDTASGIFLLKKSITPIDEVRGTLTGFNGAPGEKMTFRSDDGSITADALLTETPNDLQNPSIEERSFWGYHVISDEYTNESDLENNSFAEEAEIAESNRPMRLSDFPFDIRLSEDRQSVTLTQKPGHNFEGWMASMATYNSMYRWNIFERRRLAEHGSTITFPVYNNGCRHYLNFSGYNTANGAEVIDCELQFQLNNNELVFLQLTGGHFLNTKYKGEAALERLMNHPNTAYSVSYAATGKE